MRVQPHAQQGAALLSFVLILVSAILTIVMGFTASIANKQASTLQARQQQYLADFAKRAETYYTQNAAEIDSDNAPGGGWTRFDSAKIRADLLEADKWGVEVLISNRLSAPEGLKYRRIVAYVRSDTDDVNPADPAKFIETGEFVSCQNPAAPCDSRPAAIFDGLKVQQRNYAVTVSRLEQVAARAQTYFKARALQDPERNSTVNYFRPPYGNCQVFAETPNDLPCTETTSGANGFYASLSGTDAGAAFIRNLGLDGTAAFNGWGQPIEVANNGPDTNPCLPASCLPPFSMAVRTTTPYGSTLIVRALQNL